MTDLTRSGSVTKNDIVKTVEVDGGVFLWSVLDPGAIVAPGVHIPPRAVATNAGDRVLMGTLDLEDMWASVVNQAATKIAALKYEVTDSDDSTRRTRLGRDLVLHFDGPAEYRSGVVKTVQDFTTSRNGCFIEIEKASKAPGARPVALWHIDALRCRRTGNAKFPVVYQDIPGNWHAIAADRIIFFADMPSPRAELRGVGRPASERAFRTIVKLAAVETYFREKITGSRALALHFVGGVTKKQLEDAFVTAEAEQERRGRLVYKGAVTVPTAGNTPVTIASIDFASIPDGFNVEQERRDAYLRYANALGVPVQDIQPLSGQGLGTGTQTLILDEAAEGKGMAYFWKTLEDRINHLLMPKTTVFSFQSNDWRDRKQEQDVKNLEATRIVQLLGSGQTPGVITQQMALQMSVDAGLVPAEFLPQDVTPQGTLTDSGDQSKPVEGVQAAPFVLQQQPAVTIPAVKAAKRTTVDALLEDERLIKDALALAREARGERPNEPTS